MTMFRGMSRPTRSISLLGRPLSVSLVAFLLFASCGEDDGDCNCVLPPPAITYSVEFTNGNGSLEAGDTILIDGKEISCDGEGNGPVNALDNAIRNNIEKISKYSDYLKDLRLVDYKVRILNTGTEAVTRVSIESTDSKGKNWFTIGVSPNIIDASFKALIDSLDYKLFKDNAPASA